MAYYDDDPWIQERGLFSKGSLDCLFKYGPVVYSSRCFDSDEYDQSVRQFMARNPRISRAMAEQEINEFLLDGTGYMARTTDKKYKGPKEEELKPPVGLVDRLLVVLWVLILIPAVQYLSSAAMSASK